MKLTQNKFLTDEEIKLLKWQLKQEDNQTHVLMVEMAMFSGARSAEILEITKADVSHGCVTIRGKKGGNDRTVPLPPSFFQKLKKFIKSFDDGDRIFPYTTQMFRYIWKKLSPNKNKSLHCLRHTMGAKLYNNCEDIHAVKTLLGHKNIQNTMVYLDYVEGNKKLKQSIKGMWSNKLDSAA